MATTADQGELKSLIVIADRVGATQHISFVQPLRALVSAGQMSVRVERCDSQWTDADVEALFSSSKPNALILSRCTLKGAMLLIERARAVDIPVIFHLDDDLFDVPSSLGEAKFQLYSDPDRVETLRVAVDSSDLVYASTRALAERLGMHGVAAPIVAGEMYCSIDPDTIPPSRPATIPVIGYMGTAGHSGDLALVALVIERLMDALPALCFETFGTIEPLPQLARFGARVMHHNPVADYEAFREKLSGLGWWVGLAPLEDNPFNRCKADTKWVEYTYAGIAVVAQDLPVYVRACADGGGLLARTEAEWMCALSTLIRSAAARAACVKSARAKLMEAYSHTALQQQVLTILDHARAVHAGRNPAPPWRVSEKRHFLCQA